MQDSIPSGIHEGFYNLPFYRLLSNGSITKLPVHIEDNGNHCYSIYYSSVQAESRYFSVNLMGSKSSNKISYLHSQPIHILYGGAKVMEHSSLWERETTSYVSKIVALTINGWFKFTSKSYMKLEIHTRQISPLWVNIKTFLIH